MTYHSSNDLPYTPDNAMDFIQRVPSVMEEVTKWTSSCPRRVGGFGECPVELAREIFKKKEEACKQLIAYAIRLNAYADAAGAEASRLGYEVGYLDWDDPSRRDLQMQSDCHERMRGLLAQFYKAAKGILAEAESVTLPEPSEP